MSQSVPSMTSTAVNYRRQRAKRAARKLAVIAKLLTFEPCCPRCHQKLTLPGTVGGEPARLVDHETLSCDECFQALQKFRSAAEGGVC